MPFLPPFLISPDEALDGDRGIAAHRDSSMLRLWTSLCGNGMSIPFSCGIGESFGGTFLVGTGLFRCRPAAERAFFLQSGGECGIIKKKEDVTSPSMLRIATSPDRRGLGMAESFFSSPETLLLGELSSASETERFFTIPRKKEL